MFREYTSKVCALFAAVALCCALAVFSFTCPSLRAKAYSDIPYLPPTGLDTGLDDIEDYILFTLGFEGTTTNPKFVTLWAEYAALYALATVPDANMLNSGNSLFFSGCTHQNTQSGTLYIGTGYITQNYHTIVFRLHEQPSDPLSGTANYIGGTCTPVDSYKNANMYLREGASDGLQGYYTISGERNYRWGTVATINGDPYYNIYLGQVDGYGNRFASVQLDSSSYGYYVGFYDGAGLATTAQNSINNALNSITWTGDTATDLGNIYNYYITNNYNGGDFYWLDLIEEPTEEPTEETTESSTDTVQPFTLPPEWVETYPIETETFAMPIPPDATMPPVEIDESTGEGLLFWKEYWESFMDDANNEGLLVYVYIIIALSLAEFVIWHIGSKLH